MASHDDKVGNAYFWEFINKYISSVDINVMFLNKSIDIRLFKGAYYIKKYTIMAGNFGKDKVKCMTLCMNGPSDILFEIKWL